MRQTLLMTPRDHPNMHTDPAARALAAVHIAVLAKAPLAGFAKTRLIPALGPAGAARLQRRFVLNTLRSAHAAGLGPVTLWCAPHPQVRFFKALQKSLGTDCRAQPEADLGLRMLAAFEWHCAQAPLILVGTDCPALAPEVLRSAAQALHAGDDAVFGPAEDGGYVLVGLRQPQPALFAGMRWSVPDVMTQTRLRAQAAGLRWSELPPLWDVDEPADLARLEKWNDAGAGHEPTRTIRLS